MKFLSKLLLIVVIALSFLVCATVSAAEPPKAVPVAPSSASSTAAPMPAAASTQVLPTEFAGWEAKGVIDRNNDPALADAANAPVLKEYGFVRLERAAYARDDGRNLTIRAAVFEDASGAYGAFTYYRSNEMRGETIGADGAYLNNRVLFYQGNVLVDAVFDRMSVMSAAQLRELAGLLPQAEGNKRNPPSLPTYLPKRAFQKNFEKNTTK